MAYFCYSQSRDLYCGMLHWRPKSADKCNLRKKADSLHHGENDWKPVALNAKSMGRIPSDKRVRRILRQDEEDKTGIIADEYGLNGLIDLLDDPDISDEGKAKIDAELDISLYEMGRDIQMDKELLPVIEDAQRA